VPNPVPRVAYEHEYALTARVRKHRPADSRHISGVAQFGSVIVTIGNANCQPERGYESRGLGHAHAWMAGEFLGSRPNQPVEPTVRGKQAASHVQRALPWPSMTQ